ncbi:MAG TPA: MarR family transcriptional regulator [Solirubrobacteraceae bacterium]|nr:MarR family transcriptional regulator [Solirubrobacteraceae bacterium]
MQATSGTVAPRELAREMLALVGHLMRTSTPDFFRALSEHELTLTQVKMLHQLAEPDCELPQSDLAETLSLSLPAVSRAIDGLQERGYVARHEDDQDRRVKRVTITAEGRRVLERLTEIRLNMLERFAATLSDAERADLAAALAPVVERVRR